MVAVSQIAFAASVPQDGVTAPATGSPRWSPRRMRRTPTRTSAGARSYRAPASAADPTATWASGRPDAGWLPMGTETPSRPADFGAIRSRSVSTIGTGVRRKHRWPDRVHPVVHRGQGHLRPDPDVAGGRTRHDHHRPHPRPDSSLRARPGDSLARNRRSPPWLPTPGRCRPGGAVVSHSARRPGLWPDHARTRNIGRECLSGPWVASEHTVIVSPYQDVSGYTATPGAMRGRRMVRWRLSRIRRSSSDRPPQIPYISCTSSACR